jgi:glycosyltransferase involved in cell wall biosynthesis
VIGVLGGIGYSKGAKVLHDLADIMGPDTDIVVIGKLDPDHAHPRITVHGPYARDEIGALAARYRVGCWLVPSIWPETFCYAAHEALATGLPVFVYDLGAQAEAAAAAPNGHLLPLGCEGAALERHLRSQGFRLPADHANVPSDPARTGHGNR